jgi:tetratricopeptide (TPR) repeat protein
LAKRKIRRKALKEPDEFINFTTRILAWCRENLRIVAGVAVAITLVIGVIAGVLLYRTTQESKAVALYDEALALYPRETSGKARPADFKATIAKLEEVQKRFGSTQVAMSALVDLGNGYFQSEDYDRAISCYQDFLRRADRRNSINDQVLESLGVSYEAKRVWEAALEVYDRLAREGAPIYQDQAQLYLGRVYEALGEQEKAMSHYDNYLKTNPTTGLSERIKVKLIRWRLNKTSEEQG